MNTNEAKDIFEDIFEEIREKKFSAFEILDIVHKKADEKFEEANPECYSVIKRIHDEEVFTSLNDLLNQKKKEINYPNPTTKEERRLEVYVIHLESALYDLYQVPLYMIGLAERINKGFEWLIDEILETTESFNMHYTKGYYAAKELFPSGSGKSELSPEAKKYIDFIKCEKASYRMFAIEFIKMMCGKT